VKLLERAGTQNGSLKPWLGPGLQLTSVPEMVRPLQGGLSKQRARVLF
jgi:hypothetical protein